MAKSDDQHEEQGSRLTARRVVGGIVATLLLGALGSGLWDLLFRPGVYRIGSLVTAISSAADDAVFTMAALDPRPVPILIILLVVSMIPGWFVSWILAEAFAKPALLRRLEPIMEGDDEAAVQKTLGRLRTFLILTAVVFSGLFIVGQIGYSITNEAVVIWRDWGYSLDSTSPYPLWS